MQRLLDHDHPIDHASDHGASVSVYLSDPDGNGVELYYDRPRADWVDAEGRMVLKAERFDYRELLPRVSDRRTVSGRARFADLAVSSRARRARGRLGGLPRRARPAPA